MSSIASLANAGREPVVIRDILVISGLTVGTAARSCLLAALVTVLARWTYGTAILARVGRQSSHTVLADGTCVLVALSVADKQFVEVSTYFAARLAGTLEAAAAPFCLRIDRARLAGFAVC